MSAQVVTSIAERFHQLPDDKRKLVYQKINQDGLSIRQFPVLPECAATANFSGLSYAQQRQWFLWHLEPESSAYHICGGLKFEGALNVAVLEQVFSMLTQRHEGLRSHFELKDDDQVEQVVAPTSTLSVQHFKLAQASETEVADVITELTQTPFDLLTGPLMRVGLLQLGPQHYQLVLVLHHIIADGGSLQILVDEFITCYQAMLSGDEPQLAPIPVKYQDYALWQKHWLEAGEQQRQLNYWCQQLEAEQTVLQLGTAGSEQIQRKAVYLNQSLSASICQQIKTFERQHQVSGFMVLLSAFQVLLHRHSGLENIRVGTPVANRNRPELNGVFGLFVNTQVLSAELTSSMTLSEALAQVKQASLDAQEHQDLPFEQLVEALQPERSLHSHPLFQVMFNYQFGDRSKLTELPQLCVSEQHPGEQNAQFALTLDVYETAKGEFSVRFTYGEGAITSAYAQHLAEHFTLILQTLLLNPQTEIGNIDLLQQQELLQLNEWGLNSEQEDISAVHLKFAQYAITQPDAIAVVFEQQQLSYRELNQRANQFAHYLLANGVQTESHIGVALGRSLNTAIVLLGILKAGALFVPLDTDYPAQRLAYIGQNSDLKMIITDQAAADHLPQINIPTVLLEQVSLNAYPSEDPNLQVHPDQLAYVIYTSGSTGAPKGAAVSHSALSNCMAWMYRQYQPSRADAVLHKAAFGFDVSCWELFFPLSEGIKLVIAPPGAHKDPLSIIKLVQQHNISITNFPPAMQQAFLEQADIEQAKGLRHIMCGGEAVPAELRRLTYELLPNTTMNNLYGPTETTIHVTHWPCANDDRNLLPIGRPISATSAYVLDNGLNLVPQGVAGELYIAGRALARGYLSRPDLTADRFVADPISGDGSRMYRTGDLVRWNEEGMLEYLGRIDDQIQLRGFRIELGEIEAQLTRQQSVQEAAVLVKQSPSGEQLVAYLCGQNIETEKLVLALSDTLPDYMMPSQFVALEKMPLSPNGKVDRKALPEPKWQQENEYVAPVGDVEIQLASWWREILAVDKVGRDDNFFSMGGHSLLAIKLLDKVRKAGWQAEVKALFSQPVLKNFALTIEQKPLEQMTEVAAATIPDNCQKITPEMVPLIKLTEQEIDFLCKNTVGGTANIQDIYPLAPLQEGILFHHLLQQEGDAYITQNLMCFTDRKTLEAFIASLNLVIARHDILRTSVFWQDLPKPVQVVQRHVEFALEWLDCPKSEAGQSPDIAEYLTAYVAPEHYRMDIQQAPLLRGMAIEEPELGKCWLQLASHHLIMDHTSLEVLVDEVRQIQSGNEAQLPEPIPFRHFVSLAQQGKTPEQHRAFFTELLGDVTSPTAPYDLVDVQGNGANIIKSEQQLSEALAKQIRELAVQYEVSSAAVFHLAWAMVLSKLTGNADPVFGTVLFGRMQGGENIATAVGMFINTLPVRFRLSDIDVATGLQQAHLTLTELLSHETASLSLAQECSGIAKGTTLFSTLLNYRYSPSAKGDQEVLPGLEILSSEERTNYPIGMSIDDQGDGFSLVAQSVASVDPSQLCQYLQRALETIVQSSKEHLVKAGAQRLCDLSLLSEQEWATQHGWSLNSQTEQHTPVHVQFARHAMLQPEAVAISFAGVEMSYAELNQQANQLAHYLIAQGISAESRVAVAMARSHEMIIAILAVMKAGALYIPLDLDYPQERLSYISQNSDVSLILTHQGAEQKVADIQVATAVWQELELDSYPVTDPELAYHQAQLAYVIYTSGSTGLPKGAAISHAALANCMAWMQRQYKLTREDTVLYKAPFGFDVSCWEIFWPLSTGVKLVVSEPGDHRDPDRLISLIKKEKVTTLNFVPAMQQAFLEQLDSQEESSIKHIMVGGEAVPAELKRRTFELLPKANMYNLYGPTEATIHVTHWTCEDDNNTLVPIGSPISDTSSYVLDEHLNPVPQGVAGELYLGGVGLARGYLNQPSLTAERFVANPFDNQGGRLYRTGDLVRWNSSGLLEYLGRLDHQVKIRGLRIELGEVESQIQALPQVQEAVVVAQSSPSGKRLVAYVVGDINDSELTAALATKLPDYMVPSQFVALEKMPLSPNGKVDRKALPNPDWQSNEAFIAPQGEVEQALAGIWGQVLGREQISRSAHFFDIGGDSISSLTVVSLARKMGYHLAVKQVFEFPVLKKLAAQLTMSNKSKTQRTDNNQPIRLNTEVDSQLPVFCLHDGFGKVWDYTTLALSLDNKRTVYGLPYSRTELSEQPLDLDALVNQHKNNICAVQPSGPYTLCGWSFGAIVAHLIASKLQDEGQEVQVVLLDPYVPPQADEQRDISTLIQVQTFFSLLLTPQSLTELAQDADIEQQMKQLATTNEAASAIDELMQTVLAHQATEFIQGYQYDSGEELTELFASFHSIYLTAISLTLLPTLSVPTRIFWRQNRPDYHHNWWHQALDNEPLIDRILSEDHFEIVRSAEVIKQCFS